MITSDLALSAVRGFVTGLPEPAAATLIRARVQSPDGMACLCAVESALIALWPRSVALELVWLTHGGVGESLHLQAFEGGALLGEADFDLAMTP